VRSRGGGRRAVVPALLTAAVLLVGACAPGAPPTAGGATPPDLRDELPDLRDELPALRDQEIAWTPCADNRTVECGTLAVPLDHGDPASATVEMAVYRAPALRGAAEGTVVLVPGGPGASGADLLRPSDFTFVELRTSHDLVTFDARGVGATLPVDCQAEPERVARGSLDATPRTPDEEQALLSAWTTFAEECERTSGDALAFAGGRDVARDLDVLRAALDEKSLTLHAMSYGTLAATEYARSFPGRVARLVLDAPRTASSLADPAAQEQMVEAAEATLDDALATCFDNPFLPCPLGGTPAAARSRVEALLTGLDESPVDLGPAGLLTRERAVDALWGALARGPSAWESAARWLGRAAKGDWSELAAQVVPSVGDPSPDGPVATRCTDLGGSALDLVAVRERAVDHAARFPVFGETAAWWAVRCAGWPVGPTLATKARPGPLVGAGTVLVVTSTGDPLTPPAFPAATAHLLGGARVLTYSGSEHLAYAASPCVRYVVNGFLVSGVLPRSLSCGDLPLRTGGTAVPCSGPCTVVPAGTGAGNAPTRRSGAGPTVRL
jgi:pimeloyl-ACP methyl ester carboxylesterase